MEKMRDDIKKSDILDRLIEDFNTYSEFIAISRHKNDEKTAQWYRAKHSLVWDYLDSFSGKVGVRITYNNDNDYKGIHYIQAEREG